MVPKCLQCKKSITRRTPGLECSKCRLTVHASTACSSLTTKQLGALRAADNLDWKCADCKLNINNRSSFIVPEADTDEETEEQSSTPHKSGLDVKKLLCDISKEVEKTIKKELEPITGTIEFMSEKLEELTESVEAYQQKIIDLEKKNTYLLNQNKHLETKIAALEQRFNEKEQEDLNKFIEISGVPYEEGENCVNSVQTVAEKLDLNATSVKSVRRLGAGGGRVGALRVELTGAEERAGWLQRGRTANLRVSDLVPGAAPELATAPVYVREALTAHQRALLWKAKTDLRPTFKFVWCKGGKILVRKQEKAKIITIRNTTDIDNLLLTKDL